MNQVPLENFSIWKMATSTDSCPSGELIYLCAMTHNNRRGEWEDILRSLLLWRCASWLPSHAETVPSVRSLLVIGN